MFDQPTVTAHLGCALSGFWNIVFAHLGCALSARVLPYGFSTAGRFFCGFGVQNRLNNVTETCLKL